MASKRVVFRRESLCPGLVLTISISLHILQPPRCCYTSHHRKWWKVDPAWWLMLIKAACQVILKLVGGKSCYPLLTHGPSADPSRASWREDATFPSPRPNTAKMLERVSHQEGKRVLHKEILPPLPPWAPPQRYQTTLPQPALGTAALCLLLLQPCANHPALLGNAAWSQECLQVMM